MKVVFVGQVNVVHSVGYFRDAIQISMLHGHVSAMKTLCSEVFGNKTAKRVAVTSSMLSQQSTGTYVKAVTIYFGTVYYLPHLPTNTSNDYHLRFLPIIFKNRTNSQSVIVGESIKTSYTVHCCIHRPLRPCSLVPLWWFSVATNSAAVSLASKISRIFNQTISMALSYN